MSTDDTQPGSAAARERQQKRSTTTLMLISLRYEQLCLDLAIAEDDGRGRDAVRAAMAASYDDGVRSCDSMIRRLRAEVELCSATLSDTQRQLAAMRGETQ